MSLNLILIVVGLVIGVTYFTVRSSRKSADLKRQLP